MRDVLFQHLVPRWRALLAHAAVLVATGGLIVLARTASVIHADPVTVSIGLFGAELTALTIVLALTIDVESKWPTLADITIDAGLVGWFVVALGSVAVAAFAHGSPGDRTARVSVAVALWGAALGSYSLYRILRISAGTGRRKFLARVLRQRIASLHADAGPHRTEQWGGPPDHQQAASFLEGVERAFDSHDVSALRDRVDEASRAGRSSNERALPSAANLELHLLRELCRGVLLGRIDSTEVGTVLVPQVTRNLIAHTGVLLEASRTERAARFQRDHPLSPAQIGELQAATYLAQASRALAWAALASYVAAVRRQGTRAGLRSLAAGAADARALIADAVDPDTPNRYIPARNPWLHGLHDPEAGLIWWLSFCEFNGAHDGHAFYAMIEVLTGSKFFGTFGWGNRVLLGELEERLRDHSPDGIAASASEVLRRLGGFDVVCLELFATSLATWRDRRLPIPEGFEQNWTYWEDRGRLARRIRLFLMGRDGPVRRDRHWGLQALADLTGHGHTAGSLSGRAMDVLGQLDPQPFPRMVPTARRPGASLLAVAFQLVALGGEAGAGEIERFLKDVPEPLLSAGYFLAGAILAPGAAHADVPPAVVGRAPELPPRDDQVRRLIDLLGVVREDPQAVAA